MPRPRSFDERTVLEAAREAFLKHGYAATSMDELMSATGLGKGSLYMAFGSKRELFGRILKEYCDEAIADARERLTGPPEGAYDRLRAYVEDACDEKRWPQGALGCLLSKSVAELAGIDEAVRAQTRTTYEALGDVVENCIAAAQRSGDIPVATDARDLSALVVATLRGIEALGKSGIAPQTLRRAADAVLRMAHVAHM